MKVDLSTTFLNHEDIAKHAKPVITSKSRWTAQRLCLMAAVVGIAGYLILAATAFWEQFRPAIRPLANGWCLLTERDQQFEIELPDTPSKRTNRSQVEYHLTFKSRFQVLVRSDDIARHLLRNSEVKVLRDTMRMDAVHGTVVQEGSGILEGKTYWIEYRVTVSGPDELTMRRRLLIRNKKMLAVTLHGAESDLTAPEADRILTSARMLSR